MSEVVKGAEGEVLPSELRRRGQAAIISVTVWDTVIFGTALGSVLSLFVLNHQGTSRDIGYLATAGQLAPIAQVIGLRLLSRVGKARLVLAGHTLSAIPIAFLAILAISRVTGAPAVWSAIGAMALFGLLFHAGQTAWWPVIQDNTEGGPVEAFFARMRTRYLLANVAVAVAVALFLGKGPADWQFMATFLVGSASLVIGGLCMRAVSERPFTPPEAGLFQRLVRASRVPSIRRYVIFAAARAFVIVLCTPFWVVILKRNGLSEGFIVWLSAVMALGNVSAVRRWGRFVNRFNFRPAITIALLGEAALGLAWLAMPAGGTPLQVWAIIVFFAWGFLEGGYLMGWTRALLGSVPSAVQADGFTLASVICSSIGAVTGLVAGSVFNGVAGVSLGGIDGWMIYLCVAQLLLVGVWLIGWNLKGYTEQISARRLLTVSIMMTLRQTRRLFD